MSSVYYRPIHREVEVFKQAFALKLPILLKGPTGCGKSRFVEAMGFQLDKRIITISCNDETSATDLLGRYLIKGNETIWQDGPATTAVRSGSILYLDEIAEAREDIVSVLHSLSDHRRELYLDRRNETLKATDDFMMVVSFNPGYQQSLKEMKPSTRQRFISLAFSYPPFELEVEILENESKLKQKDAIKLVKLAEKIRKLDELGLTETVSTRLLVSTAKLINSGLDPRLACEVGIIQTLTDDRETIMALKDLTALSF
jgi:nitric oxide reductase NorQ protein